MRHLDDEELILWHYGESVVDDAHFAECAECAARYAALINLLDVVEGLPVPERGPEYWAQVWRKIGRDVAAARRGRWPSWVAIAAAAVLLVAAGFVAGRRSVPDPIAVEDDGGAGQRVLQLAVADHLERSQMVLVELVNSNPNRAGYVNILSEQERAGELLSENRLYRQTAQLIGQTAVASGLEELERALLNIEHSPSEISARELEDLRQLLEAEDTLFKIRVLRSNVGIAQLASMERGRIP